MSNLSDVEKRYLEKLLGMGSGFVLDYSDATYGAFFKNHSVDIHSSKFETYGTSKAKKMRSFWEQESDALVGKVLSKMLDGYEVDGELKGRAINKPILEKCRAIVARLQGQQIEKQEPVTENSFLYAEFTIPNIAKLPLDSSFVSVIEARLEEARLTLKAGAYLSVIFLCGSVLEAVLLGVAEQKPAHFNRANAAPKDKDGNVRRFHDWNLAQLIDVASEIKLITPDIKKFGHGLRYFRNYIHPYEQVRSSFSPDQHTAKLCFQVLKAALADVAGERK